ncbi:MAG TPA: hypothetical protein VF774_07575 [Pseudoduganella sp.]
MRQAANDRSRATARCTRTAIASLALSFVLGILPVAAQDRSGDGQQRRDGQQGQQQQGQQQSRRDSRWGDAADARSFEARAEEQRRIMQENANNAEMSRRMSRMTPDERRDLRRQINEAGMEVYSNTPRR